MFLTVSLLLSSLLLVLVNCVALRGGKPAVGKASLLSAAAAFPLLCTGVLLLPFNALLVAVAGAVCWSAGARPRWFLAASLGGTAAAYGLMVWLDVVPELRAWHRLQAVYPMESLAARLAYEDRRPSDARPSRYASERLTDFESQLEKEERTYDTIVRLRSLKRLHAGVAEQFTNSPGFGVGRQIMRPSPFRLESVDERRDKEQQSLEPMPQVSQSSFSPEPTPGTLQVAGSDLVGAHEENALAFLNPFDFGYVRDREQVAGFRPHRFHRPPGAPQRWQVEQLELVSLLKHDEPVAYRSNNLPKMDELRDTPTRPLDAFEQEALAALRQGEDLMLQEQPDRMRMLGSLRAAQQCLRCHRVSRGDLLGAFSYKLVREATAE
jgi:hypothetical protein